MAYGPGMGGNALKHLSPVRLSSAQVIDLVQHLTRNWQLVEDRPFHLVPWVAEKADHGDIDLVCETSLDTVWRFLRLLGVPRAQASRNGVVISAPLPLPWQADREHPDVVQVDFICCSAQDAAATRFFYAGGDFGMLLGRVAAWQGLVFGMDGLRYRAERGSSWQRDVHLSRSPAEILRFLGYPAAIPWFDTYDTLWRFVLSSPLAGAWMFLPEATNHENRSRDQQRRKVGDFQDWLRRHYGQDLQPRFPRATPAQAQDWVRQHVPRIDLDAHLAWQQAAFDHGKRIRWLLGRGAVEAVIGPGHPADLVGTLVRSLQRWLPPAAERQAAAADPQRWPDLLRLARTAAAAAAAQAGLTVQDPPPPLPAFEPPPSPPLPPSPTP